MSKHLTWVVHFDSITESIIAITMLHLKITLKRQLQRKTLTCVVCWNVLLVFYKQRRPNDFLLNHAGCYIYDNKTF